MKFVDFSGNTVKGRRFASSDVSVNSESLKDPAKLCEIIQRLSAKIASLEARTPPEYVELEKTMQGFGGVTEFAHGFGCPVRWYAVDWHGPPGAVPAANPDLVRFAARSTPDVLALSSQVAGRVVIRIEPSQHGLST